MSVKTSQRLTSFALGLSLSLSGLAARAGTEQAAKDFHRLLIATLPREMKGPDALARIHMLPDVSILSAIGASTPQAALQMVSQTSIDQLVAETLRSQPLSELDADQALREHPITLVIVPGIFGEFIPTRGFEDVLSKPSAERENFKAKVGQAARSDSPAAQDLRFTMSALGDKQVSLTDVINVGSLTDARGKTLARVILLYTDFMSLESLGDLEKHAQIFNRRLGKYLEITGPQKLAFIGYSRGTVLGLEMLAQAQAQKLSWLPLVKGMISLGGVAWGSVLADEIDNPSSAMSGLMGALKTLRDNLDPESKLKTFAAWGRFGLSIGLLAPKLMQKPNAPKASDLKNSQVPTSLDPRSVFTLIKLAWTSLGLQNPNQDFANNVRRFQALVDSVLSGVNSLKSSSRLEWWKTHSLPRKVTYYAITAAMANPEASALQKSIFDGAFGYSRRSYDDLMLLQNRLDYENLAKISLNDSQVSVAQAMFLPEAMAQLNPSNRGLKTEMLGTLGTHHWGLALRIVNAMKDGRLNPFPREALLKALAAKVALDQQNESSLPTERFR